MTRTGGKENGETRGSEVSRGKKKKGSAKEMPWPRLVKLTGYVRGRLTALFSREKDNT